MLSGLSPYIRRSPSSTMCAVSNANAGSYATTAGLVGLRGREQRVHPEGARLVGDDRHPALAELLVLHQVLEEPDEGHRGGDLLLAGAALHIGVRRGWRQREGRRTGRARRQVSA